VYPSPLGEALALYRLDSNALCCSYEMTDNIEHWKR
jgi:hypothetical protein